MAYWKVMYEGLWLGGKAIVIAKTKEDAIKLVQEDNETVKFEDIFVEKIKGPVLYNDNGNY